MSTWFNNRKQPFNQIVFGFAVASLASVFEYFLDNIFIYAIISLIGFYYIASGFFRIRKKLRCPFGLGYKMLLLAYMILICVMIIRGYLIDYQYPWISLQGAVNAHVFNRTYIICWLMPLITFIPRNLIRLDGLVKVSEIFAWVSIICFIVFFKQMYQSSVAQAMGKHLEIGGFSYQSLGLLYLNSAFISLCRRYVSNKVWLLNFIALVISLVVLLMAGRRGSSAVSAMLILFSLFFWLKSKSLMTRAIVTPLILLIFGTTVYMSSNMTAFRFIQKRGLEDTRSGVDIALMNQMDDNQLIWGKGLNGRYYYPISYVKDEFNGWRYMTETGYYLLILKGGYVFAWLYILILLIPSLRGLFDSRNLLSRAFGFYILLSLFELYPWGHPTFNLKFLVIWVGVTMCMSKKFRHLSNAQIKQYFFICR